MSERLIPLHCPRGRQFGRDFRNITIGIDEEDCITCIKAQVCMEQQENHCCKCIEYHKSIKEKMDCVHCIIYQETALCGDGGYGLDGFKWFILLDQIKSYYLEITDEIKTDEEIGKMTIKELFGVMDKGNVSINIKRESYI